MSTFLFVLLVCLFCLLRVIVIIMAAVGINRMSAYVAVVRMVQSCTMAIAVIPMIAN